MPRFKLTIEYAGTRFSGWQIQKNARTIQGEIDRAVRDRHRAQGFRAVRIGPNRRRRARDRPGRSSRRRAPALPPEYAAAGVERRASSRHQHPAASIVPHRFHARHDAVARRYLYQCPGGARPSPSRYVWWVKDPIDVGRMREAAQAFVGMRDFQSFSARAATDRLREPRHGSTLVLIDRLDIVEAGSLILIGIEGSHFLWKMVRRMVGVLVEIGRGEIGPRPRRFSDDEHRKPGAPDGAAFRSVPRARVYEGDRVTRRRCARSRRSESVPTSAPDQPRPPAGPNLTPSTRRTTSP